MKLSQLAATLGIEMPPGADPEITGVNGLEKAGPGEISFLANRKYTPLLRTTRAAAVFVPMSFKPAADAAPGQWPTTWVPLRCDDPYTMFARALEQFYQPPRPATGVHPTAVIAPTARIGEGASIGPYVVIGEGVRIGARASLHAHVVIYSGATILGDGSIALILDIDALIAAAEARFGAITAIPFTVPCLACAAPLWMVVHM